MFNFFKKRNGNPTMENPSNELAPSSNPIKPVEEVDYSTPRPNIRENDFIDNTDPNDNPNANIVTINYGTNMPIDSIFAYIEKDWEEQGRQDALKNPDANYMQTKVDMIRETLKRRFEQVRLRYKKDLRNYQAQLLNLQQLGLENSKLQIEAYIETCQEHLVKIDDMQKKLESGDSSMTTMMDSYKRGFSMGVATAVDNLVNV